MRIKNITGLFDEQNVLEKLTKLGDPLVLVSEHIDFSLFKDSILKFTGRTPDTEKPGKGRPSYDVVTMMKIIFLIIFQMQLNYYTFFKRIKF